LAPLFYFYSNKRTNYSKVAEMQEICNAVKSPDITFSQKINICINPNLACDFGAALLIASSPIFKQELLAKLKSYSRYMRTVEDTEEIQKILRCILAATNYSVGIRTVKSDYANSIVSCIVQVETIITETLANSDMGVPSKDIIHITALHGNVIGTCAVIATNLFNHSKFYRKEIIKKHSKILNHVVILINIFQFLSQDKSREIQYVDCIANLVALSNTIKQYYYSSNTSSSDNTLKSGSFSLEGSLAGSGGSSKFSSGGGSSKKSTRSSSVEKEDKILCDILLLDVMQDFSYNSNQFSFILGNVKTPERNDARKSAASFKILQFPENENIVASSSTEKQSNSSVRKPSQVKRKASPSPKPTNSSLSASPISSFEKGGHLSPSSLPGSPSTNSPTVKEYSSSSLKSSNSPVPINNSLKSPTSFYEKGLKSSNSPVPINNSLIKPSSFYEKGLKTIKSFAFPKKTTSKVTGLDMEDVQDEDTLQTFRTTLSILKGSYFKSNIKSLQCEGVLLFVPVQSPFLNTQASAKFTPSAFSKEALLDNIVKRIPIYSQQVTPNHSVSSRTIFVSVGVVGIEEEILNRLMEDWEKIRWKHNKLIQLSIISLSKWEGSIGEEGDSQREMFTQHCRTYYTSMEASLFEMVRAQIDQEKVWMNNGVSIQK
jgi:hypothetical protein